MQYPKAPIIEAIFDIQIDPESDIDPEVLTNAYEKVKKNFPLVSLTLVVSGRLHVTEGDLKTEGTTKPNGKMFSDPVNNRHIQMRKNGYTFNMQAPYTSWDNFSSEAFKYYSIYKEYIPVKKILKISLRYINKINIPLPFNKLNDILCCIPPTPEGFPNTLHGFFMNTQIPFGEEDFGVSITQTLLNKEKDIVPFLLDIEVASHSDKLNEDLLKEKFERFREIKNKAFENSITSKTKELFK